MVGSSPRAISPGSRKATIGRGVGLAVAGDVVVDVGDDGFDFGRNGRLVGVRTEDADAVDGLDDAAVAGSQGLEAGGVEASVQQDQADGADALVRRRRGRGVIQART